MRLPKTSLATAAILGSGTVGLFAVPAHAAETTLFVANVSGCSDQTTDSSVDPYCSVHGALAVVQPGQTVQIAQGTYYESDVISAQGTAGAPITITAAPGAGVTIAQRAGDNASTIVDFEHAAYVTLSGVRLAGIAQTSTVLVNDSSHISLTGGRVSGTGPVGVTVTGSDATLVAREAFGSASEVDGVLVTGGSTGTVVAASTIIAARGVRVDGAADTAVTGITADASCGAGVEVENGATGTTIENSILGDRPTFPVGPACLSTDPASGGLVVAADSVAGTHADYNLLDSTAPGGTVYRWGTQTYGQAADFHTATSQGAHDIVGDPKMDADGHLTADSPAIDSADSAAVGEQGLDVIGAARVLDPDVTQTGVGPRSYDDRGAQEFQDPFHENGMEYVQSAPSFKTFITASSAGWKPAASYTFDFGDGHPVTQASPDIIHTFPAAAHTGEQSFPVTITATEADTGTKSTSTFSAQLVYSGPGASAKATAVKSADGTSYSLALDASGSTGGTAPIASYTFSVTKNGVSQFPFSKTVTQASPTLTLPGMTEGDYTVVVTVADTVGVVSGPDEIDLSVPVRPAGAVTVHRIAGADRYQTGVAVSQQMWAAASGDYSGRRNADAVVLATGMGFADAVAGVPLAAKVHGPLLLTDPSGLSPVTAGEISRILEAHSGKIVYVLGGGNAVSPVVDGQLKALGYTVVRFGGADRFATALAIAKQEFPEATAAYVATGEDYADALSAGPLAAAVGSAPVLLTNGAVVDGATADYLRTLNSVTTVGWPAATALSNAGIGHEQLTGATRYDTAAAVAAAFPQQADVTTVGIATGTNYADALTGGAMMAVLGQPLLLTEPGSLPSPDGADFAEWLALKSVSVFGGTGAVSDSVVGAIVQAVRGRQV